MGGMSAVSARRSSRSGWRTASATGTKSTVWPVKRSVCTDRSAATMMQRAAPISAGVSTFLGPSAPFVSTLMRTPISAAVRSSASAAIKVCATPIGQAVTASSS